MSITYNEILDSMKAAFQQEKGEAVADLSDLELRFKAVASEIYSGEGVGLYSIHSSGRDFRRRQPVRIWTSMHSSEV